MITTICIILAQFTIQRPCCISNFKPFFPSQFSIEITYMRARSLLSLILCKLPTISAAAMFPLSTTSSILPQSSNNFYSNFNVHIFILFKITCMTLFQNNFKYQYIEKVQIKVFPIRSIPSLPQFCMYKNNKYNLVAVKNYFP